ncbi:MAG: hypothetical protein MUF54_15915 [Polyangiaceae bacterium]|nr:hypothetical protein [Polyangiaceae bacterium]
MTVAWGERRALAQPASLAVAVDPVAAARIPEATAARAAPVVGAGPVEPEDLEGVGRP